MSLQYTKTHTVSGYTSGDLDIPFTFDYLDDTDIKVYKTDTSGTPLVLGTDWQFKNKKEITLLSASVNYTIANNDVFLIQRETQLTSAYITYAPGSAIRAEDLNSNQLQSLYSAQEREERTVSATGDTFSGNINLSNSNLVFYGANIPPADNNETTLTAAEPTQDNTITLPNRTGTVITSGDTDTVNTTMVDGSLVNANIAANAEIAVSKLANGTARQVLQTAANGTDVEFTSDVDLPGTLDVTGAVTFDSTLSVQNATSTFSNVNITGNLDVDTTANLDAVDIDDNVDLGANLNFTGSARVISAVDNNATALTVTDGADTYLTFDTTTGADKVVTNKTLNVAGNLEIAGTQVTSSATNLNIVDGMTKSTTLVTSSNTEFPTSKAVADWVNTQLDAIDGFVAIADENSFPNTQPPDQVTVSIADAGGIVVNGSGVGTGQTAGGAAVTINNFASNFHNSTIVAGVRLLVESTGSGQVYNYHKATLKESDLVQLSDDINDFNERYRTDNSGSNPATNNDSGDLFFNQATGKMLVYNGVTSAWEEVQSIGQFFEIPASELADFAAGTAATEIISNAPTTAQQIILSINGVIQKPSSGTGTPTEGFTLNGGLITLAATPPAGSTVFGVIIGSSVNIGTPSAGTVGPLQLADDGVNNDKLDSTTGAEAVNTNVIRDNAITSAKIADDQVTEPKLATTSAGTTGLFLQKTGATTMDWAAVPAPSISNASTFTGDNNTTQFTIVTGHTVHSILVVLNGLVLRPTTDYTVSGTTLTFTSAPGTGDEIDVRYLPI